ncbi:unnamed protein product [Brassicogethes aeneus]|uniref:Lipase n=1 Tax=Brassicogethes aeneus TaxID=1431903 RepID=A0A9P0FAK6_BRAAE|nr:unnamed protein product [Brassicogethes aeneus]
MINVLLLFGLFSAIKCKVTVIDDDPVKMKNFSISEYITSCGYPFELHQNIQTEDGYLLDVQRIPHGKTNENDTDKPVVLLMHGLLGSAENFVLLDCESSLAFYLAEQGYDVWMGNARGTAHSRKHLSMDPDVDTEYWEFSWHEIGIYDIPATIDYIRKTTNKEKIFYVGHSQGCTVFLVMTSEKPEYNNYIQSMVAMAPAAYITAPSGGLLSPAFIPQLIKILIDAVGMEELKPSKEHALCLELGKLENYCSGVMQMLNIDPDTLEPDVLGRVSNAFPAGAAVRQVIHYTQEMISGKFCQYDHEKNENLIKYGSEKPPSYNISKIVSPVAVFYSMNDTFTPMEGVKKLIGELPNLSQDYQIPTDGFSHLDFVVDRNVVELVYSKIVEEFKKYM